MAPALTGDVTRQAAVARLSAAFADAGIDTPMLDARLLVGAALGVDHAGLVLNPDKSLGESAGAVAHYAERRLNGEPVSRILGRREFWGLSFSVTPDVLDPRADSEALIAAIIAARPDRRTPMRILDLGAGTGALLGALLQEYPFAFGVAVDRSETACRIARNNLAALGFARRCSVICGDWGAAIGSVFDIVVSNPPYIESAVIAGLAPEVRNHDPLIALDGGADGMASYRAILRQLPALLNQDAIAALEMGAGQAEAVVRAAQDGGLVVIARHNDLAGVERALILGARLSLPLVRGMTN